jgi:hypothetical protein
MALFNPAQVTVTTQTSSSATPSTVAASVTSGTIVAANSNRKGLTIWNDSTANLHIDFDASVSTTDYAVKIAAGGYYEMPFNYTGIISGIWDTANGNARVRELI